MLFVGINPGLTTLASGAPFSTASNRFFPALHDSGITDRLVDTSKGWRPEDREHLLDRGVGITALSLRATSRAGEVPASELRGGVKRLQRTVAEFRPTVVAVLGITGYRVAFATPSAVPGRQPDLLVGARVWCVPNPSGRNRGTSLQQLVDAYRAAADDAGLVLG